MLLYLIGAKMERLYISDKGSDEAGIGSEQKPLKSLLKVCHNYLYFLTEQKWVLCFKLSFAYLVETNNDCFETSPGV